MQQIIQPVSATAAAAVAAASSSFRLRIRVLSPLSMAMPESRLLAVDDVLGFERGEEAVLPLLLLLLLRLSDFFSLLVWQCSMTLTMTVRDFQYAKDKKAATTIFVEVPGQVVRGRCYGGFVGVCDWV